MRTRSALLSIALLLAVAHAAAAQQPEVDPGPVRAFAGGGLQVAQPTGEFGDHVGTGFGLGGHFLYTGSRAGALGLRLDGSFVNYGHEQRPVRLSPTVGGRITVDLTTSNNIAMLGVGPQLMLPRGRVRPYAFGTAGLAYFITESSLSGDRGGDSFASTTNHDDLTFAYGGGVGLYIPVARGRVPVSIDMGARFQRNGRASYLREGSIRDEPDGDISFDPIESEADLLTFQVGVSAGLRRSPQR